MGLLARLAATPLAALIASAAPAPSYVPLDKYGEVLVIPADSPVTFERFGEHCDLALFSGTFVIEGVFVVDCNHCEAGYKTMRSA